MSQKFIQIDRDWIPKKRMRRPGRTEAPSSPRPPSPTSGEGGGRNQGEQGERSSYLSPPSQARPGPEPPALGRGVSRKPPAEVETVGEFRRVLTVPAWCPHCWEKDRRAVVGKVYKNYLGLRYNQCPACGGRFTSEDRKPDRRT